MKLEYLYFYVACNSVRSPSIVPCMEVGIRLYCTTNTTSEYPCMRAGMNVLRENT